MLGVVVGDIFLQLLDFGLELSDLLFVLVVYFFDGLIVGGGIGGSIGVFGDGSVAG